MFRLQNWRKNDQDSRHSNGRNQSLRGKSIERSQDWLAQSFQEQGAIPNAERGQPQDGRGDA